MEAEIAHGIVYRTVPVALAHDFELVAVESGGFETYRAPFFGNDRSYEARPQRQLDGYNKLLAERAGYQGAEFALSIGPGLADDIFLMQGWKTLWRRTWRRQGRIHI